MRIIGSALLLGLCLGCGDGTHAGASHPGPDEGAGGEASAGESGSASVDGGAETGGNGGARADGGSAGDGDSAGDGGSGGEGLLPDEPDNGTRSGSRLKAEWYDFDGTRVFADFYDTELEAPCMPGPWSDGKTYCIPVSTATQGYTTNACAEADMLGHVSFNPACSSTSPGYMVLAADNVGCGAASEHVYRLSQTATTLTQYFAPQNGGCTGPYSTGYNSDTYPVTGEVLPAELVEFTREDPADPGRISRQYIVTADGARLAISPYDRELSADCSLKPDRIDEAKGACAPTDTRDVTYYTDTDCKDAVVSGFKACDKPGFARQLEDRACGLGPSKYYAVGDAVKPDSLFVGGANVCVSTTASSQYTLYALGDPVTVQPLTRVHDDVAGQNLQLIYFSDGKKRYLDQQLQYDAAHDTECQINVLPDGTIVCVPFGSSVSAFYEETCTSFVRVGLVYYGAEHCDHAKLPPFLINPGAASVGCSASYEIRERGAEYTGKAYLKGDTCELYSGLELDHFYEPGPVRPFSEFPTAKKVRDQ